MSWDAVLIAGPTASGKSALAMEIAARLGGVVVNADSMQVYRELRVLTARPTAADEAQVPHLLYGHVPVAERYSAGRYLSDATEALTAARAAQRIPVFTGGTGLYFRVLTDGLSPIPRVPHEIRDACRERLDEIGAAAFHGELAAQDPETAAGLRPSDTQRMLRAASVLAATERPLRFWQQTQGTPVLKDLRVARFIVSPPREHLRARIDARFAAMMDTGALEEVRALAGLEAALPAARALGVPQLQAYLRGEQTREAAVSAGQGDTRRYAKRQLTWFRRFMSDWKWLEIGDFSKIVAETLRSGA
jgi:tRNA dimethylallyltransferase